MTVSAVRELSVGSAVDGTFLVKMMSAGKTATNADFTRFTLSDGTGQIAAVLWDGAAGVCASDVVRVTGTRREYNSEPQLQISTIVRQPMTNGTVLSLLPAPEYDTAADVSLLHQLVAGLIEQDRCVMEHLLLRSPIYDFFLRGPAADGAHHATQGGLLHHSVSTAAIAGFLAGTVGVGIDVSLLTAGALLHDIGKLWEYRVLIDSNAPLCGEVLGHIFMGASYVRANCPPSPRTEKLVHLLLSHHGKEEWGSPVRPRLPEAALLHLADLADARSDMLRTLIKRTDAGAWSEFSKFFNASFYKEEGV